MDVLRFHVQSENIMMVVPVRNSIASIDSSKSVKSYKGRNQTHRKFLHNRMGYSSYRGAIIRHHTDAAMDGQRSCVTIPLGREGIGRLWQRVCPTYIVWCFILSAYIL